MCPQTCHITFLVSEVRREGKAWGFCFLGEIFQNGRGREGFSSFEGYLKIQSERGNRGIPSKRSLKLSTHWILE